MTIPIHEVLHDTLIIHQCQTHNAVPIKHFLQKEVSQTSFSHISIKSSTIPTVLKPA